MRIALLILGLAVAVISEEDYYKLLGIERDADDRTIRKAFKKLAIQKHPDKNKDPHIFIDFQDNPQAHAEFVKINKAYEVLKDEETRKKYDQFGEKGLEDGFQGGNTYESWQFYNENFGIYDDDPEIITLNRADFQRQVSEFNEMWFINFYSTFCSHCHQLAPTWRKFAKSMEGAIRIGAVNCAEDPGLCQSQRVYAYPSLVIYPTVLYLKTDNIKPLAMEYQPYSSRPWIIDFCQRTGDCLSNMNRRKLAAMLEGLVNVGTVDCSLSAEHELCEELDASAGVSYYPARKIQKGYEQKMDCLDPKELAEEALGYLDDIQEIGESGLKGLLDGTESPTAVLFVQSKDALNEKKDYKKLPAALPDVKKLPQFVTFKTTGGYEIDYANKKTYYDVRAFIKESITSPLHVLSEEAYNSAVKSGQLWIIDYFAPWCPPCLRLIGEYRRLHSIIDRRDEVLPKLKIGLIDCQKFNHICQRAGVQSYPTSALYTPDGRVQQFVGFHAAATVLELID
ncbi:hypothetical protein OESDEN_07886, partial [Oesophagostomum dentatum]